MRDHDHGTVFDIACKGLVDEPLALHVDLARGLVEHEDLGVAEKRPGKRDSLPLAAGQAKAVGAHHRLVAVGKFGDEFVGVGLRRRFDDLLFGRIPAAVADVVEDRLVEQLRLLCDHCDAAAQIMERHVGERHAVEEHGALGRVVEPADEVHERALAAAVGAHDRHPLAERDREVHAREHRVDAVVAERHVLQADLAMRAGHALGLGRLAELRGRVEQRIELLGAHDPEVHTGEHARELPHRIARSDEHPEKHHDAGHRHRPLRHREPEDLRLLVDHEPGPDGDRRGHHADAQNLGDRVGEREVEAVPHARLHHVAGAGAKPLPLELLHRVGLHGEHVVERLEEHVVEAERLGEDAPRDAPDLPVEPHHQKAHHRGHRQAGERELPGDAHGPREAGRDFQWFGDGSAEHARDAAREHVRRARDLGHEAGRAVAHELRAIER